MAVFNGRRAKCNTVRSIDLDSPRHLLFVLVCAALLAAPLCADSLPVRQVEGQLHGFLVLRTLDGAVIADGDLTQVTRGSRVTSRLIFHFKDGSVHDETTVFTQSSQFHLLADHLVQKGPTFKHPMDVSTNGSTGLVTVRYTEDDGKEKVISTLLKLPPDLVNGMVPVVLKNLAPGARSLTASMVVATPKPMLVKLAITAEGEDPFLTGSIGRKATHYVAKVEIGGVRGVVAPLVGKQPPDTHIWVLGGDSPALVKLEGPFCESCPIWRMELATPVWPKAATGSQTGTADRKK